MQIRLPFTRVSDDLYPTVIGQLRPQKRKERLIMLSAATRGGARLLARRSGAVLAGTRREMSSDHADADDTTGIATVTVVGSGLMGSGIAQVSTFQGS